MDFALNEEQLELQEMVRDFVEKEITPYAAEMDRNNQSMPGLLEKAADMGLLNVIVPEEYGGPGLDSVTVAVIYEELGKGCAGVATSMAANSLASYPILIAGTEEQKQAHCDLLNDGKLAAFALTEPGAGSDAGGVATSALEMSQNSERLSWTFEEVDGKLKGIMETIYANISDAAKRYNATVGGQTDYVAGANIAGFEKVVEAMIAQGIV